MLSVGCVYHDPNFKFSDGSDGNKLFIVLGKDNSFYTVAKTTSQQHSRKVANGCQGIGGLWHSWFHPLSLNRCFKSDTWICFNEFYTLRKTQTDASFRADLIVLKCAKSAMSPDICAMLNCALLSIDLEGQDETRIKTAFSDLNCKV